MKKQKVIRVPLAKAPAEKKIVFCISLYFAIPKVYSRQHYQFKTHLKAIADKRNFIESISDKLEKELFRTYLTTKTPKVKISVLLTKKTNSGVYLINKNLQKLVDEIMTDYESGILKVQPYTKPRTKTELNKKINEYCKEHSINVQVPLRKPTVKEEFKKFKEKSSVIDQLNPQTGEEN